MAGGTLSSSGTLLRAATPGGGPLSPGERAPQPLAQAASSPLRAQLGDQRLHLREGALSQPCEVVELRLHLAGVTAEEEQSGLGGQGHAENGLRDRVVQLARQLVTGAGRSQLLALR